MLPNYADSETLQKVLQQPYRQHTAQPYALLELHCTGDYRFYLYTNRSWNLHQPTNNLIFSI
jgi:hypothetical protein